MIYRIYFFILRFICKFEFLRLAYKKITWRRFRISNYYKIIEWMRTNPSRIGLTKRRGRNSRSFGAALAARGRELPIVFDNNTLSWRWVLSRQELRFLERLYEKKGLFQIKRVQKKRFKF